MTLQVLVHTRDAVGERMAGPGIRAWHLARELARHFPTTLVARLEGALPDAPYFRVFALGTSEAREALRGADVVVGQPARGLRRRRRGQRLVIDLFDPVLLELKELYGAAPSLRQRIHFEAERWRLNAALGAADLFLVAAARQKELYRVDALEVPFGLDVEAGSQLKLRENIVLWGGGTWEWLDPKTAVDAVVALNREGTACRLLFLGRSRPNRQAADRRREDRLDVLVAAGAPFVEANPEWIPYRDRLAWLRRSKIAIMLHRPTPEAAYSIRTRLFDAMAAAVPVVATEEGFAAELVEKERLGLVVPPGDVDAVAGAVRRLLRDDGFYAECVSNLHRVRPRFAWDVVTRPLIETLRQWQTQDS
jgi:glycosyltransferase involved in cell wall biosynthesis